MRSRRRHARPRSLACGARHAPCVLAWRRLTPHPMASDVISRHRRRHRARLRLHQRLPRHRQRRRHLDLDRGGAAAGRDRGRLAAQLRRRLHLDLGRGDRRQRRRQLGRGDADRGLRRPDRGDRLEPDHLVLRPALELLARADRRRGRLCRRRCRLRRRARRRPGRQGADPGRDRADPRLRRRRRRDRARLPDRRQAAPRHRHPRLPLRPDHLQQHAGARPRHQRRAEDDGHHHPGAGRQRHAGRECRPAALGDRHLGDWRSRSAPTAVAGGSSAPPAPGSSRWTPPRASPRRARARR